MEIIPAIMPKNLDDLNKKYSQVKGLANIVQIDVMDGKFVSSISWPYIEDDGKPLPIDFAQFMGIEKIGFQGQLFDERVLGKIADLRERFPKVIISVDGGVNMKNAPRLIKAGANRLVSGSTIFESDNIKDAIEKLKNY